MTVATIDYDLYPHIIERIFEHAAQDTETLIALRGVNKHLVGDYEEALWSHIAVGVRHVAHASGIQVLPTLYAPHLRADGSPVRLPLDIDFAVHGLNPTRPTDAETLGTWRAMKRARAKLIDTATVDWWAQAGANGPSRMTVLAHVLSPYTPIYRDGDSSAWASTVMNLFRTSIFDPFEPPDIAVLTNPRMWQAPAGLLPGMPNLAGRRLPLLRLRPTDTPWSKGDKLPWPKVAATWLDIEDDPTVFWGALQGRAQHVDVYLALEPDGLPAWFMNPPRPLNFHAQTITIHLNPPAAYLLPQPGGGAPPLVPATHALGITLATLILLAVADGCDVTVLGQEMLDIAPEDKHPNPAEHPYVRAGGWAFVRRAHADYWLMGFLLGLAESDDLATNYRWLERMTIMRERYERQAAGNSDRAEFSLYANLRANFRWRSYGEWCQIMPDFSKTRLTRLEYPREYFQGDLVKALKRSSDVAEQQAGKQATQHSAMPSLHGSGEDGEAAKVVSARATDSHASATATGANRGAMGSTTSPRAVRPLPERPQAAPQPTSQPACSLRSPVAPSPKVALAPAVGQANDTEMRPVDDDLPVNIDRTTMFRHIAIGVRYAAAGAGPPEALPTVYAPQPRVEDGTPIRLPLNIDFATKPPAMWSSNELRADFQHASGVLKDVQVVDWWMTTDEGGGPNWANNVAALLFGDSSNSEQDATRPIPIMRFPSNPTPWSRNSGVPWPEVAVSWITSKDGPDAFWDACTGRAESVDVHLELEAGGLPAKFLTLPSAQREYATSHLTIILHPPPEGGRVPANDALGTLLSTATDIISGPSCTVHIVGIEFLDIPAQHPGLVGSQYAALGEQFILMANARYWLSTFYRGRNLRNQAWLDHFDYSGTIVPRLEDEFVRRGCPGSKGTYAANLGAFVQDFWDWYTAERWEAMMRQSPEPGWHTVARLTRGEYPSQYFLRERRRAAESAAEYRGAHELAFLMGHTSLGPS